VVSVVVAEVGQVAVAVVQWAAFKVHRHMQALHACCTVCPLCALDLCRGFRAPQVQAPSLAALAADEPGKARRDFRPGCSFNVVYGCSHMMRTWSAEHSAHMRGD
jgi:hypothetical protein